MKFRKKPVVIEAMQFNGSWSGDGLEILDWMGKGGNWTAGASGEPGTLRIHTLEGTMTAVEGDWVIKGVKGEFYPCKPDIFVATYDVVSGESHDSGRATSNPSIRELLGSCDCSASKAAE